MNADNSTSMTLKNVSSGLTMALTGTSGTITSSATVMALTGYDIATEEGYQRVFAELGNRIGFTRLLAFHLNDSKKPLGSRVDRHENIGLGALGLETFRWLVNDERFSNIPGYLETPSIAGGSSFPRNLRILRSLAAPSGRGGVQKGPRSRRSH